MSTATDHQPVLVVGGTGKTGSRVVSRLEALGVATRPVSRSSAVPFDWNDRSTWPAAIDGVGAAYLTYYPDVAFPGAKEAVSELAGMLAERGVERIVLLSGRGEEAAKAAEDALLAVVPTARAVRCSFFAQNFTEGMFAPDVMAGQLTIPVPDDVPEPFLDVDDIADVVVAALRDDRHAGEVLELTGPESLTFPEAVGLVADALGRPVGFRVATPEEYVAAVVAAGEPAELGYGIVALFAEVLDGRNVATTDTVARVLGRPATSLSVAVSRDAAALSH
ncbi:NmrA family NAD(P)-binding protein [Mumia sp. DW29H23]|uniref:NmrA family NAD(P)-binding protein n=1 Tax=Mumia sp. DW29H23 TaxID=3421241 RepID=UPI003D68A6B9